MRTKETERVALICDERDYNPLTNCRVVELGRLDKGIYIGDDYPHRFIVYKDDSNNEDVVSAFKEALRNYAIEAGGLELEDIEMVMRDCGFKGRLQEIDEFIYLDEDDEAIIIGDIDGDSRELVGDDAAFYIVDEDMDDVHLIDDVNVLTLDKEMLWVEKQRVDDLVTRVYQEILTGDGQSYTEKRFLEITMSRMHSFYFAQEVKETEINLEYVAQDLFKRDNVQEEYY